MQNPIYYFNQMFLISMLWMPNYHLYEDGVIKCNCLKSEISHFLNFHKWYWLNWSSTVCSTSIDKVENAVTTYDQSITYQDDKFDELKYVDVTCDEGWDLLPGYTNWKFENIIIWMYALYTLLNGEFLNND